MKRWYTGYIENEQIDKFVQEIKDVCKKYEFSITADKFTIRNYTESFVRQLDDARIHIDMEDLNCNEGEK